MKAMTEVYKGYKLICTPQRLSGGKYGAKFWIQKDLRSHVEEFVLIAKPYVYESEEDAAHASRIAGHQWVDEQG